MKKLVSAVLVLIMIFAFSVSVSAVEYLIPIKVNGASGTITMTIETQKNGHKDTYQLEFNKSGNYEATRKLEPNNYQITEVLDENKNTVLLDKYNFTIEDTSESQTIILNASPVSSQEAEKYSNSLIKMLGIGSSDIAAFVVLIILAVVYYFIKKKKEKDLKELTEDSYTPSPEEINSHPSMKITEYSPEEEGSGEEK